MTFPTIAARTATADAGVGVTHAIGLGTPSAGDLLIVFCAVNGAGGPLTLLENVSGDRWSKLGQFTGSTARLAIFAKIAQGGDALSVMTVNNVRASSLCYRFTGHGSSVAVGSSATATSTNGNPPAVSISGAAQDVVFLAVLASVSSVASAPPAGYGTLTTSNASTFSAISIAERNLNGTTDDPGAFTNSSQDWIAVTVAVPELSTPGNVRTSQASTELISSVDANAILSQLSAEVSSAVDARILLSQFCVEMVSENVPDGIVSAQPVMLFIAT